MAKKKSSRPAAKQQAPGKGAPKAATAKGGGHKGTAHASPKAGKPAAGKRVATPIVSVVLVGILGALATYLLFGYSSLLAIAMVPLLVGAMIGLCVAPELPAAAAAAGAGAVGGLLAGLAYQPETYLKALNGMPEYANLDIVSSLYQNFLLPIVTNGPVGTSFKGVDGAVLMAALCALLTGAVAFGVAWYVRSMRDSDPSPWIAWAVVGLLGVMFLTTALGGTASSGFTSYMSTEPQTGQYSFDPTINLKTIYLMTQGQDYYHALVNGAAGDARLIKAEQVKDGRISYPSPANIREPFTFYLWRVLSFLGGPTMLLYASVFLCIGLLVLSYLVFMPALSYRALFVPMFVFPALMMHTVWSNILHPDWWAALALLYAVVFLALDRPLVTGGLMLAACLMRETMLLWAAVLMIYAVVRAFREKSWRLPLIYLGMFAGFVVAFWLHLRTAAGFIQTGGSAQPAFVQYIMGNAKLGIEHNFLAPTSYLMLPYGQFAFPLFPLLLTGIAGFWLVFSAKPWARWVGAGCIAAEALFYLTIGATSSYWGQHVMPLAIIGTAALLAIADRALVPREA